MWHDLVLLLVAAICGTSAQLLTGIDGYQFTAASSLCNQTFGDANSTGIFAWDPNVPQVGSGSTLPVSLGVTVTSTEHVANASAQWELWYSTNGANYSYNFGLGYDVCAFVIEPTSENTIWRGQNDNGDCKATFDDECVHELQSMASQFAMDQTVNENSLIRSNLTADSLPQVCKNIASSLKANFPKHCQAFLNGTALISGGPLTSYNESGLMGACSLKDAPENNIFHHIYTYTQYTLSNAGLEEEWYNMQNWLIAPVMLTFMPIANSEARASIPQATSRMICIHANRVNPGSEAVKAAPTPTPVNFGGDGLSGGAIAGVVIGVVAAVILIAGGAFLLWRRKRKAPKKLETTEMSHTDTPPAYTDAREHPTPMVGVPSNDAGLNELSPANELRPELSSYKSGERVELAADSIKATVKGRGNQPPAELFAEVPNSATYDSAR